MTVGRDGILRTFAPWEITNDVYFTVTDTGINQLLQQQLSQLIWGINCGLSVRVRMS